MRKSGPYRRYRVSNFGVPVCSDLHGNRMRQNFCSALALPYNRRCLTCRPCLHFPVSLVAHICRYYFRRYLRPENSKGVRSPGTPPPLPGCKTSTPAPLAGAVKKLSPGHIPARQKFPPSLHASGLSRTGKVPVQRAKVIKAQHLRLTSGTVENDCDQSKSTITEEPKERNPIINPLFNVDDKEATEKRHDNEPGIRPTHLQGPPA